MSKKLKVGDKVFCIDATGYLVKGEKYTITKVWDSPSGFAVNVKECVSKEGYNCYRGDRFKLVLETIQISREDLTFILTNAAKSCFYNTESLDRLDVIIDSVNSQTL